MSNESYLKALYEVHFDEKVFSLKIGEVNSEFVESVLTKFSINDFAIITAYNPKSEILEDRVNLNAHVKLGQKIRYGKWDYLYGTNKDPDGKWPEEKSYVLWGISKEQALELANEFNQNAIVWGNKKGELQLVWCSPK